MVCLKVYNDLLSLNAVTDKTSHRNLRTPYPGIMFLHIQNQLFKTPLRDYAVFHEILTEFLLLAPLERKHDPDLIGREEPELYAPLPEHRYAAIAPVIEDVADRVLVEPAPAHGNGTDYGTLTPLPGKGLDEGGIGDHSPVVKVTADLKVKRRHVAMMEMGICIGTAGCWTCVCSLFVSGVVSLASR